MGFSIKLEKRLATTRKLSALVAVASVVAAFAVSSLVLIAVGGDPSVPFTSFVRAFVAYEGITDTLERGAFLILVTVGLAIVFKMNFWNIGGEGQLYMGALASAFVVYSLYPHLLNVEAPEAYWPPYVVIPLMFVAAFAAGGAWALLAAVLKAKLGVNEILTTLMLNYVAIQINRFLVYGPWNDPRGWGFPLTPPLPNEARFPDIGGVSAVVLVALTAAVVCHFLLTRTKFGLEVRVIGDNPAAASYAGISYFKVACLAAFISGGLAGLAGLSLLNSRLFRLRPVISEGYGYTAIITCMLGGSHPIAAAAASVFFASLMVGAGYAQLAGVPLPFVQMLQATALLFLAAFELFRRYRIVIVRW